MKFCQLYKENQNFINKISWLFYATLPLHRTKFLNSETNLREKHSMPNRIARVNSGPRKANAYHSQGLVEIVNGRSFEIVVYVKIIKQVFNYRFVYYFLFKKL